jgi:hypothetical protein
MTLEPTVHEFEQVEFCQTRPVLLSTGWRMVRNVEACLVKDPMCLISVPNDKVFKKWLMAVGECGGTLTAGVPVLYEFYAALKRHGANCSEGMLQEIFKNRSQLHLARGLISGVVDAQSRVSFYYAFGILPDHQVVIERFYRHAIIHNLNKAAIEREALIVTPGVNIAE